MGYEIIREPYILLETVEVLFRYVNGFTYQSFLSKRECAGETEVETPAARCLNQLQEIMDETCSGVNLSSPAIQRFFALVNTGRRSEDICLARCLTLSFTSLGYHDLDGSIKEICDTWRHLQEKGAWIKGHHQAFLDLTCGEGCPGELIEQICALPLPADFQLSLYRALRSFDRTMAELAELIRPVAEKLRRNIGKADHILSSVEQYWRNTPVEPLEFLQRVFGPSAIEGAGERTEIILSTMNYNRIFYDMENSGINTSGRNFIFVGCGVTANSSLENQDILLDNVSATLKILSDRRRLDVLRRLSKERSYCHELAEIIGADPGNMSRTLAILHNYGFLQQQREAQRNYYQTDKEAIHSFFQQVEELLFQ